MTSEGVGRERDPEFNTIKHAEPFVSLQLFWLRS
jgi:predicted unusual protein kinase regulating ubiquinone biosynthesis (AarF/ABC1/UbiB family)